MHESHAKIVVDKLSLVFSDTGTWRSLFPAILRIKSVASSCGRLIRGNREEELPYCLVRLRRTTSLANFGALQIHLSEACDWVVDDQQTDDEEMEYS